MARIALCGTQSVGKSTLVNELRKDPKYADYDFFTERSNKLHSSKGVPLNGESTQRGQMIFLNERIIECLSENFISDRSFIDVSAFTHLICKGSRYLGQFDSIVNMFHHRYTHLFYIPIEIELEDNGIRDTNVDFRYQVDRMIRMLINKQHNTNIIYLTGTLEERVERVNSLVK